MGPTCGRSVIGCHWLCQCCRDERSYLRISAPRPQCTGRASGTRVRVSSTVPFSLSRIQTSGIPACPSARRISKARQSDSELHSTRLSAVDILSLRLARSQIEIEQLVTAQMATGKYSTENDVLLHALRTLQDYNESAADIQLGIADEAAGRMRSLHLVDSEV